MHALKKIHLFPAGWRARRAKKKKVDLMFLWRDPILLRSAVRQLAG